MKIVASTLLLLASQSAFAQDMKTVEQRLLPVFQRIEFWTDPILGKIVTINRTDSLEAVNNKFQQELTQVTTKYPASLQYSFPFLRDSGLIITTSPDGS